MAKQPKPKAGKRKTKEPIRTEDLYDATDTRPPDSGRRSKNQEVEKWLEMSYDFRYNVIKQKPEWKEKAAITYNPIDKYKLLSIKRELDAVGHSISKDGLLDILCSSFAPAINPVKDYFNKLQPWKKGDEDYIMQLANTVQAKNDKKWNEYFRKWLIGVVANVFIDEHCANHVMLVLTGEQGKFKTTWLDNLCPKSLRPYLFTGKLNLESKDTLTLLAEYLFVNIDDQLKQLHKKDENDLKNLITAPNVKYRRPYDPIITEYPHLCSFMGSVNGNEFLNDPTGSRRFMPFEVLNLDIDKAKAIDMDKVWSQVVFLYKSRERYWFNDAEIIELNARNAEFSMTSQEEEYLHYYFYTKAKIGSHAQAKFLPSSIILSMIEQKTRTSRLSAKKLGEALSKAGVKKIQKANQEGKMVWGYILFEKTTDEIETQSNYSKPLELQTA
jgi:predicted P-loop ATPase